MRLLCALLCPMRRAFSGVLGLVVRLLCAVLGRAVTLLRALLHPVPNVIGGVLGVVTRVLHVLLGAVVVAGGGLLSPPTSRRARQSGG